MTFIADENPHLFIEHLDGVPWYHADVPPRKHTCWAQTRGVSGTGAHVERCACGSIRNTDWDSWLEKNSRAIPEEVEEQMDALEHQLVWLQRTQYVAIGILIGIAFIITFWALAGVF